ncbi:diguanylate cyclase (GGDEF)-like protein [Actinoplanes campanulatus]|uniref:Diguanylate cyclase (GGDEF)-like protein n=2 Tax=Actinoplanes campanulatus TaxID=113559 RepID=A0A7W5ANK9_9ACTN|nr:EAL domain-containing protein [Actinoplanes campanulatus]MBB3099139.1 diguanylate cyclase (GGDEF)-like protein [Actinoplanes campanulatus]
MARPGWLTRFAVLMAVSEVVLIVAGTRTAYPVLLVWVPAVAGLAAAVTAFRGAAVRTGGDLRAFWRRVAVAMGFVLLAGISQTIDVVTLPWSGMPPIGARTLCLYVAGTVLAITALLRLPGGGRTWRQLLTAVLDVAVVAVTGGIATSQYIGWFMNRFGVSESAWWLNIAMIAIAVAGAVVVVKIMTARRSPIPRASLWWLAPIGLAGPLSTLLMTALRPWPHLNGSAAVLPFVGLFGVLAAHAQHRRLAAGGGSPWIAPPSAGRRGSAVPLVATGLVSLLVAIVFLRTGHLTTVQVAGTTMLLLLVVARQAIALAENNSLLDTVARQAMQDELTGLFSRRYFTAAVASTTGPHTVVLIDLKEFRAINDGLGPAAGDALLTAYAERLTALAGRHAVVARLGGDEFGLLLTAAPDTVDRLLASGAEPLSAAGHELLVEVSIGVTDGDTGDAADSYRRAELALREAMAGAGGRVVRYDATLERQLSRRATVAADLRRGLAAGEFHLLYQPIVNLPDGRLVGVESLVRWGDVSPAGFIPVAEDTGLIVELGAWILDTACAQAAEWRRRHGPDALRSVAVNVSARQLLDPALPEIVAAALARHGLPAQQLTIEITETAVFGGGRALASVTALSELGVNIALDDFGTGHSSLGLLRTCPVDAIKVDKSFVDGLGGSPQQEAIAIALTGIAETMGLRTVAEGVETAEQAQRLYELGYRQAQGFHFARPLPADAIDEMLAAQQNRVAA